jgi:hypothetical protein
MLSLRFVFMMLAFYSLLLSWLLAFWLVILHLLVLLLLCHLPDLRLFLLLLVVRVLVFTVIIVVAIDMWRHSAIGRRKLRRLGLAILHRVLVLLVLEDLRGVLLVQRHRRFSCCFIVRSCWFCDSVLCTYRFC